MFPQAAQITPVVEQLVGATAPTGECVCGVVLHWQIPVNAVLDSDRPLPLTYGLLLFIGEQEHVSGAENVTLHVVDKRLTTPSGIRHSREAFVLVAERGIARLIDDELTSPAQGTAKLG